MRFFRRGEREQPEAPADPAEAKADPLAVYLGLRSLALGHRGGPTEPFEDTSIVAVLLDWPQAGGCATIAAMADGTTSLYTSTGGGILGSGAHASVREANRRLMLVAQQHLEEFPPVTDAPVPPLGRLAIVVRTIDGLRRAAVAYHDLQHGNAQGQAVFDAANEVTTAIRVASAQQEQARHQA
jgi:hypothetical protein